MSSSSSLAWPHAVTVGWKIRLAAVPAIESGHGCMNSFLWQSKPKQKGSGVNQSARGKSNKKIYTDKVIKRDV